MCGQINLAAKIAEVQITEIPLYIFLYCIALHNWGER